MERPWAASSVREPAPYPNTYPNRLTFVGVRRCSARPDRVGDVCDEHARVGSGAWPPRRPGLLSGSMARLAYNGHDGFPRVIPVGFYWTGERIVVSTAPTSPKARALSFRPEVALTIDTGSTPEEAKALGTWPRHTGNRRRRHR